MTRSDEEFIPRWILVMIMTPLAPQRTKLGVLRWRSNAEIAGTPPRCNMGVENGHWVNMRVTLM